MFLLLTIPVKQSSFKQTLTTWRLSMPEISFFFFFLLNLFCFLVIWSLGKSEVSWTQKI